MTPDDASSLSFEAISARVLPRLLQVRAPDLEAEVRNAVQGLVEFLDTDRATVFLFDSVTRLPVFSLSWGRAGIPSITPADVEPLTWFTAQLRAGRVVRFSRLPDDLPPDTPAEHAYIERTGQKSILLVPVQVEGNWVCALSTGTFRHYRDWSALDERRARFFAEMLGAAVHRCRLNQALEASLAQVSELNQRLSGENLYLREELGTTLPFKGIVGECIAMKRVLAQVEQVADTGSTVLILGETGTGKELIARAIHDKSRRRAKPLVKVNCAALPAGLVESELFGHERGAFTGALTTRPGRFEVADGGTLFLDEVGDLPLESQAKLLRVLQEGEFERLGSTKTRKVDVRIVAATNRMISDDVRTGRFRQDLYYRLGVFVLALPPLRERRDDMELLTRFIIERRARTLNRQVTQVPREVMARLEAYDWPGNVRELENVLERALILSRGVTLELDEALTRVSQVQAAPQPAALAEPAPDHMAPPQDLESFERAHITSVLESCGWKVDGVGRAAERLRMNPSTLRSRMKKLGIRRPRGNGAALPAPR